MNVRGREAFLLPLTRITCVPGAHFCSNPKSTSPVTSNHEETYTVKQESFSPRVLSVLIIHSFKCSEHGIAYEEGGVRGCTAYEMADRKHLPPFSVRR